MARKYVLGPNAAREFKRLIRGSGEVSRRQNLASAFAFDSEFVFPFTVQWAQSVGESGSWIIWLPGDDIVSVDGAAYDPTKELKAAGGDYPEGWYLLDGKALDRDKGGKLYLNMTGGTSHTFEFSASAQTGVEDSHSVAICEASVDAETGARSVKQFVTSSIIIASGDDNNDTRYGADEHSITLLGQESTDPTQIFHTNYFHLYGFGKFQAPGYAAPIGTYMAPTATNVDLDGDAPNFAFICRDGNSSSPDSNTISYRKISFRGANGSSPFKYVKTTTTDPNTHQPVTLHKLENCKFYWNGELQELPDFDTSALMGGGTVYLTGKQAAPSASSPSPEWTWAVATAEAQAPNGGKVLNFKLYEFAGQKVKVDYRTTFLSLEDTTQKAYYQLKTVNGSAKITLDATGASPKIEIVGEDGKKITLDVGAFPSDCKAGALAIRSFKYTDKNGDQQIYHGLFCADIDLGEIKGDGGSDVEIKGGTGIKVAETKTGDKVTATVSNTGVIGLVGQDSSHAANGTITTKGANGSGLKVTVTRSAEPTEQAPLSNGTLEVDIDGRGEGDSFGPKELQLEGKKVATIFGTANVNIKQKKIAAGTGVEVAEANGVVTISATGAATSGFTGSRTVLADTQYSGHYLQKRFYTETWKDGVLESSTLGNWITYHTAVEETA